MSEAENLLNTLSSDDIALYTVNPETEEHIIIDDRRIITVPEPLRRIAVQYDHNIETVTFDCPRYWDNNDLSKMYIYINYRRADNDRGRYLTKNVRIDETDSNMIHFDWTIGNEITVVNGGLSFLVCAVKTDSEGNEEIHWNTELNNQMTISNGLECEDAVLEKYPDVINDIFTRLDTVISDNAEITANNSTIIANNAKITANAENLISTSTELTRAADTAVASHDELAAKLTYIENNMEEVVGEVAEESFTRVTADLSNEFYRVKDEVLETGEASGSYVTLNDSAMAQMQELEVNSVEKQKTTTGVNKLDTTKLTTTKTSGVDVKVNEDGSITFNGTMEKTLWLELSDKNFNLPSGDYTWRLNPSYKLPSGDYTIGIRDKNNQVKILANFSEDIKNQTLNEDLSNCFVAIYIGTLTTFNNFTIYPMLVSGTYTKETIPQFEKYTGGTASPNPDYPQEIKTLQGKNLFNKDDENMFLSGIVPDNNGLVTTALTDISANNYIRTIIIPCNPNTTYTLSRYISGKTFYVYDSEEYPTLNYQTRFIKSNTGTAKIIETITTSSNAHYILLKIYNTYASESNTYADVMAKIQIEKGSTATLCVPYGHVRLKTFGKNLYNYEDMFLLHNDITIDEEGWMTAKNDNTNGTGIIYMNSYPNNLKLLPNTRYNIFIEVKNVVGTGQLFPCSAYNNEGQFITSSYFKFSDLSNGIIKNLIGITRDSLEGVTRGLRTFLQFGAGEKGSITFRLSVIADTTVTPDTFMYEPYQESILNIPIPEGEFVGYINDSLKDTLRVDYNEEDGAYHLYLDKVLGKVVLNGSEGWGKSGNTNDTTFVGALAGLDNVKNAFLTKSVDILVSHFKRQASHLWSPGWCSLYNRYDGTDKNYEGIFIAFALGLDINKITTIDEFKAWLSENKPEVVYVLAEPYTLDLGMVDMPLSYDETTNIFLDTDFLVNINAKYYRNFTETVRNLQINNNTLKTELENIESRLSALEAAQANESGVE